MTYPDDRRMTALIVEDNREVSDLGAVMLREFDLCVDQVWSAEEAIGHLRDRSGDITILLADIHLPGDMDGVELAHRVSVLWPTISVIVTSGDPAASVDALPDGAVFVQKPWRALDIVAIAERASRADHSVHAIRL